MESEGRICPYCGGDQHSQRTHQAVLSQKRFADERLNDETLKAMRAELKVRELEDSAHWDKAKIQRQKKRIKQLENKLHEAGIMPYANREPWNV